MTALEEWFISWVGESALMQALVGGTVIAGVNAIGALLVVIWRRPSQQFLDAALGFAAGVMLTAAFTSLILPGIEYGGIWPVLIGMGIGIVTLDLADHLVPHMHAIMGREGPEARIKAVWLFIIAVTLHNMPEGLAVGVRFGSDEPAHLSEALKLMTAIGLQNLPEGLAVAVAALGVGIGRHWHAAYTGIKAGVVELPLAVLGAAAVQLAQPMLPYAMGFAAGAMLYVISDEIVPETHRKGHERIATMGTMLGAMVMLYLDVALG